MLLQAPWEAFEPHVRSGEEFIIGGLRRAGDTSGIDLRMVFRCAHLKPKPYQQANKPGRLRDIRALKAACYACAHTYRG